MVRRLVAVAMAARAVAAVRSGHARRAGLSTLRGEALLHGGPQELLSEHRVLLACGSEWHLADVIEDEGGVLSTWTGSDTCILKLAKSARPQCARVDECICNAARGLCKLARQSPNLCVQDGSQALRFEERTLLDVLVAAEGQRLQVGGRTSDLKVDMARARTGEPSGELMLFFRGAAPTDACTLTLAGERGEGAAAPPAAWRSAAAGMVAGGRGAIDRVRRPLAETTAEAPPQESPPQTMEPRALAAAAEISATQRLADAAAPAAMQRWLSMAAQSAAAQGGSLGAATAQRWRAFADGAPLQSASLGAATAQRWLALAGAGDRLPAGNASGAAAAWPWRAGGSGGAGGARAGADAALGTAALEVAAAATAGSARRCRDVTHCHCASEQVMCKAEQLCEDGRKVSFRFPANAADAALFVKVPQE